MFNFASKLINTLGDLVSVEEPPSQPPPKSATTSSTLSPFPNQRRVTGGGDVRAYQQPKLRFQGPASAPSFRGPGVGSAEPHHGRPAAVGQSHYRYPSPVTTSSTGSTMTTMTSGGSNDATNYQQRQVTNVYSGSIPKQSPYGSTTMNNADIVSNNANSTTGIVSNTNYGGNSSMKNSDFMGDRRETNALFETTDIDYQEDGYNIGGNFNSDGRQSYEPNMQKDYGMYREHDNDDSKDYEDDDRYSLVYEDDNRHRRSSSYRENSPMQNTNECDNQGYSNTDQDYYDSKNNQQSSYQHDSNMGYSNLDSYSSNQEKICDFSGGDFIQFDKLADEWSMQAWKDDQQIDTYQHQSTENSYRDIDEKPPSSPPEGDDNKNSSRSESESSDEISFGEALATGLIPPHITPEIAARMNIELMNHPKAVIESFYGHSPGEVYTIPEEEDEICSPTGADGVTSLRKQRMASAYVEMSDNAAREVTNQRQIPMMNAAGQPMSVFNSANSQQSSNAEMRQVPVSNAMTIAQQMQPNQGVRFQSDQGNTNQRPPYRSPAPQRSQFNPPRQYQPENQLQQSPTVVKNPNQQTIMPRQDANQNFPYFVENQPLPQQTYSTDPCPQSYPGGDRSQQPTQSSFVNVQQQQNYSVAANVPQPPSQQSQAYQASCLPPRLINPRDSSMHASATDNNQHHQSALGIMQQTHPHLQQQIQPPFYTDNRQFVRGPAPNQQVFHSERQQQPKNTIDNRPQQGQTLPSGYPMDTFPQQQYYQNEERPYPLDQMGQSCNIRQPQQLYQAQQYPAHAPPHPGYHYQPEGDMNQPKFVDNRLPMQHVPYNIDKSQPQHGQYVTENRKDYCQDAAGDTRDNRPRINHPSQPPRGYYQENRQPYTDNSHQQGYKMYQQPESKRLNQPTSNCPQTESLQRQRFGHGYQQDSLPPIVSDFRDSGHQARRQLPRRQDSLPSSQQRSSSRRYPLQRFHSEERYSSYESNRSPPGPSSHDNEYQRKHERTRQRSSSLDSYERNDPFYYSGPRQRDDEYGGNGGGDGRTQQKRGSQQTERVVPRRPELRYSSSLDEEVRGAQEIKSRLIADTKKEENYCAQHKRYTSGAANTSKPTRRILPKEPMTPTSSKKITKRQTKDKGTSTIKSGEESAHQKGGILSSGTRRVERGGNLKISFSDPISKVQKSGKIITATIPKTDNLTKTVMTKSTNNSNKPVISSNVIISHSSRNKATNTIEISPSSGCAVSPVSRNASSSSTVKDNRLLSSSNVRSLPVPIVPNRTRRLDRYSSSETNLNMSSYNDYDQFLRPGSAPGLMYEPIPQPSNAALQLSLYEMHALKKEEKFWSDIYSALPADMKHLVANRGRAKMSASCSPTTIAGGHPSERQSLENRLIQRAMISKGMTKSSSLNRETTNSSLGERIGNRLRMLHEMKEQAGNIGNRRKNANSLSRRSASDSEYSFSSATNFPMYWNLARRPHSDSAIDLLEHLDAQGSPMRVCGSAYNSSEYLPNEPGYFRVVDRSQSYLTSPSTNIPPSPAPTHPVKLRDTVLRAEHVEHPQSSRSYQYLTPDNRSGFFSCLQNIESLTRQYKEEDRIRTIELDPYEDEIYSDPGIPESDYGKYDLHPSRRKHVVMTRRRNDHF